MEELVRPAADVIPPGRAAHGYQLAFLVSAETHIRIRIKNDMLHSVLGPRCLQGVHIADGINRNHP
jgi:hypothetical protein